MKVKILKDSYFTINLSFIAIILAIFGYSLFFGAAGRNYPLPSGSAILTGKPTVSTGLSRSFSALMRFDLKKAKLYNRHGIRVFLFFLAQLVMRTGALAFYLRSDTSKKRRIVRFDILFTVLFFMISFWPFLTSFANMIAGIFL